MCPGDYNPDEGGVYGTETVDFLSRYNAGKAIISAGGLTPDGITDADTAACRVKRAMIERSNRRILLLDSGKFGVKHLETVCRLNSINDLVTDAKPDAVLRKAIEKAGVKMESGR